MKKLIFIILIGTLASCQVQEDPELQKLNLMQQQLDSQVTADTIRLNRIHRFMDAGMTRSEAETKVDSIYKF